MMLGQQTQTDDQQAAFLATLGVTVIAMPRICRLLFSVEEREEIYRLWDGMSRESFSAQVKEMAVAKEAAGALMTTIFGSLGMPDEEDYTMRWRTMLKLMRPIARELLALDDEQEISHGQEEKAPN